jgi:D-methionine transport system substrate-binding protein
MKKFVSVLLASSLLLLSLAGCKNSSSESKTITVGASATPHAEILKAVKPILAKEGYTLNIKIYDDYVLPNTATEDGELDANYFQHKPYLDSFNEKNNTHLVSVAAIHYEPYGIYAGTSSSLTNVPDGAKIAVPNDPSNEARALQLLAAQKLITIKDGAGLSATKKDISANPHHYDVVEMDAAVIPKSLDSVALAVINGNYAIGAGLKVSQALATEDKNSEAAKTYANIIAVKQGNENKPAIKALVKALQSQEVKDYITKTYDGAVVAVF